MRRVLETSDPIDNASAGRSAAGSPDVPGVLKKRTRRFWGSFGILLVILIGYNVLIHRLAERSQRRQMLATLDLIPVDTDFLFLGNSLVEAGCDVESFEAAWPGPASKPHAVNLALGATSPVEHDLILRHALSKHLPVKYLVYGFFDDQLNSRTTGNWDDLVGNRAFSYYFPDQAAKLYASGSLLKKWELRVVGHIPMLAERSSLWTKVELLRRNIEDIGMEKKKTNRFGRVEDFAALEPRDLQEFNRRCDSVLEKQSGFSEPVRDIIEIAKAHHVQLILLEMPMPSRHREIFYGQASWPRLRGYLQQLAVAENIAYLPASDWIKEDDKFEDATHLNPEGAKIFSAQLAAAIGQMPRDNELKNRHEPEAR